VQFKRRSLDTWIEAWSDKEGRKNGGQVEDEGLYTLSNWRINSGFRVNGVRTEAYF
jgi:hypothetical protein